MIIFLSDFGIKDGFAGVVKGVIKRINPDVEIIDLSHEITPQMVDEAAYVLWSSYKYFPQNSIFLCVVDPGVGSKRKIVVLKTKDFYFIAPDNGILKYIISEERNCRLFELKNKKNHFNKISDTFHGRDILGPSAAYLSLGMKLESIGREIPFKREIHFIKYKENKKKCSGKVIYIDHFGNLISNIKVLKKGKVSIKIGNNVIKQLSNSYSEAKGTELIALVNSANLIEVAINKGNAALEYGLVVGHEIVVFAANYA